MQINKTLTVISSGVFGINTYIIKIGESKAIAVDPAGCSLSHDNEVIVDYLKQENKTLIAVFLTHGHFDHIMNTARLKEVFPSSLLCCHKLDASLVGKRAEEEQRSMLEYMGYEKLLIGLRGLPNADILFNGKESLDKLLKTYGKLKETLTESEVQELSNWQIIHTPGHTEGSSCLYNAKDKCLISGDTLFYQSYGRVDFPGGSEDKMVKSLTYLYENLPQDTRVYPGHDYYGFKISENY